MSRSYPAKTLVDGVEGLVQIVAKDFESGGEKPILIDEDGGQWTWANSDPHTLLPYEAPEAPATTEEPLSAEEIAAALEAEEKAAAEAAAAAAS